MVPPESAVRPTPSTTDVHQASVFVIRSGPLAGSESMFDAHLLGRAILAIGCGDVDHATVELCPAFGDRTTHLNHHRH